MHVALMPGQERVKAGNLFYLAVRDDKDRVDYRQFLAIQNFHYGEILELIRYEGLLKTEDVYERFYDIATERELIEPADTYILELGERGRVSDALQNYQRHKLNHNVTILRLTAQEIDKMVMVFKGPECDLHVLKVDSGDTLAQVRIFLDDKQGLLDQTVLDIVGPPGSDFPECFDEEIEHEIQATLQSQYPTLDVDINVKIRRSELAMAREALYERHKRSR